MKGRPSIPRWLDDAGLALADFRIFCDLCRRADNVTGEAWPSYAAIAKTCGVSRATVARSLKALEARGFIVKAGKPFGGSCRYRITPPIVSPEERMSSNSLTSDTNGSAPIVSPENYNRSSDDTPIVSPEALEGSPIKVLQRRSRESSAVEVFDFWNARNELPEIQVQSPKRKAALKARMAELFFRENWREAFQRMLESPFLMGTNDRGWRADIDWFLKPDSVPRIMEGKYAQQNIQPKRAADLRL
jgi:DNA-binding transcriptional MocR family regulator